MRLFTVGPRVGAMGMPQVGVPNGNAPAMAVLKDQLNSLPWSSRKYRVLHTIAYHALQHTQSPTFAITDEARHVFSKLAKEFTKPTGSGALNIKNLKSCEEEFKKIDAEISDIALLREKYTHDKGIVRETVFKKEYVAIVNDARRILDSMKKLSANTFASVALLQTHIEGLINDNGQKKVVPPKVMTMRQQLLNAVQTLSGKVPAPTVVDFLASVITSAENEYRKAENELCLRLSPTLRFLKKRIDDCSNRLRNFEGDVLQTLCFGTKGDYATLQAFQEYYTRIVELFNKASQDATSNLDTISTSLGLPTLREERKEASWKHSVHEWWSKYGSYVWGAIVVGTAASVAIGVGFENALTGDQQKIVRSALGTIAKYGGGALIGSTVLGAALVGGKWLWGDDDI